MMEDMIQENRSDVEMNGARGSQQKQAFSKYGSVLNPPRDDAVVYPNDDQHSFFARGRDFESRYVNHQYTTEEREYLSSYESMDYLPSHSLVYKQWLRKQPRRLDWDRWVMMGLIGFSVGFIGFLLHQLIDVITEVKLDIADKLLQEDDIVSAWGASLGYSLAMVVISSALVVFVRPSAGGSGIPELIGFLNGTLVRHIFNLKTLVVKFLSCCAAVGSGLPVGPEGPMIHLGSLVGAGLSQFKSDTLGFKLPFFERFRNSEDRRNFISAGAAAGIASAFGAPVGGLLFSMEEVSSFWNDRLSWQIFFCSMVSTFTTDLLNSAFDGFRYTGDFGAFKTNKYILFNVETKIPSNLLVFLPALVIGAFGGIFGAAFTFLNLKITRLRKRLLSLLNKKDIKLEKLVRLLEPCLIMIFMGTFSIYLPRSFGCTDFKFATNEDIQEICGSEANSSYGVELNVRNFTCPPGVCVQTNSSRLFTNRTYNEPATLLMVSGEEAIRHLFSRGTHLQFSWQVLLAILPVYFILACWCAGSSISSGLVVPMLFIGGLYGRALGVAMVMVFGIHTGQSYWSWMDPGAFALIGAASFFGGVSRLTMSLTVIMMEITNDIQFLLPIMLGIMVAKWVGDLVTHPLYHALLELKCIPFLDSEPVITHAGSNLNLELHNASEVMSVPAKCIHEQEKVGSLAGLLLNSSHGVFPVVRRAADRQVFVGTITRLELIILVSSEDHYGEVLDDPSTNVSAVDYERLTLDKLSDPGRVQQMLETLVSHAEMSQRYVNLYPYVNRSATSVRGDFSLHRTYILLRTMGLRHVTVTDNEGSVIGVITRKDLMGFAVEERLALSSEREMIERRPHIE